MMGHRWRVRGDGVDLVLTLPGVALEGHHARCTLREAESLLLRVMARSPAWSLRLRELDEAARAIVRWHPSLRRATAVETVRAALRSGVLEGYSTASVAAVPLQRDELETRADVTIPLASDLIDRLYEKGIEHFDVLEDEEFGAIEETCELEDEEFAGFEDETELEPEEFAGFEEQSAGQPERFDALEDTSLPADEALHDTPDGAAPGAGGGGATAASHEIVNDEVFPDEESTGFEDEGEARDSDEVDWGDAQEPSDDPDAHAASA